jgi:hypothetical protein
LTYTAEINSPRAAPEDGKFEPTDASRPIYESLRKVGAAVDKTSFKILWSPAKHEQSRAVNLSMPQPGAGGDVVTLSLQRVKTAEIQITAANPKPLWKGIVPIPTAEPYDLPIPTAALFGTQKLGLSLSEAGAITAIDYGKSTGAAGTANAATTIVGAVTPESTATKAADIKAQADLIAQQQRLHRCLVNPTTCQ